MVASCAAAGAGCRRSASAPQRMTARTTAYGQRQRGMSFVSRGQGGKGAAPGAGPGRRKGRISG
ncbi:hypothetical protein ACIA8R_26885 [Nonomuraea sp. NPDC051191]|uniref:hypothetical protein n=1 Tax=Nonomuraea sp. NPDC051191 TaxID=3364372 RepID=UPI0037A13AD3